MALDARTYAPEGIPASNDGVFGFAEASCQSGTGLLGKISKRAKPAAESRELKRRQL